MKHLQVIKVLSEMHPNATRKDLGEGVIQLHWAEGNRENSITFFPSSHLNDAQRLAFGANDIQFLGNFRFSSTVNP